jgi:DNA-binding NarL/FixJ family response regulator
VATAQGKVTPLRTVLVDDVEEMRDLLRILLKRDGRFEIVGEAADGRDGVRVVSEQQPDVVVLDVNMPTIDGLTALPMLHDAAPHTRIVMLSGMPADQLARPAIELGAVGYIEKQTDSSVLADRLHALAAVLERVQRVLDATYVADPRSPRQARADLRAALRGRVHDNALDVVELLTTELVVNAIQHAGSNATVTAEVSAGRVRVAVADQGPGVPVRGVPSKMSESGRGLALVETLATGWGVDVSDAGKTVWFEAAI